jgi:hypothetical protein
MSLLPPGPSKSQVGDVWVDPLTARRYIFTGENLDDWNYGWMPWELRNEQHEYEADKETPRD